jgi:hypothetical protein
MPGTGGRLLVMFALIAGAKVAAGQTSPTNGNAQVVDISKFRESHPALNLLLTPLPDMAAGQIPDYGGPIQNYLNVASGLSMQEIRPPFGGSGIATFAHRRLEILGNLSGIFVPFQSSWTQSTRPNAWFTQATFGARFALDPGHHIWAGVTGRYTADFADKTRQHGLWSADLTYRH